MYALFVTFRIHPGKTDEFVSLMTANRRASVEAEPGCQQFDICRDGDEVFLYEIYDDRAAFDAHTTTDHFYAFEAAAEGMIAHKEVRFFDGVIR